MFRDNNLQEFSYNPLRHQTEADPEINLGTAAVPAPVVTGVHTMFCKTNHFTEVKMQIKNINNRWKLKQRRVNEHLHHLSSLIFDISSKH
jgi:hypothetical protein